MTERTGYSKDDKHIYFSEENVDVISIYEMCNSMLPLLSATKHLLNRNYINILFQFRKGYSTSMFDRYLPLKSSFCSLSSLVHKSNIEVE